MAWTAMEPRGLEPLTFWLQTGSGVSYEATFWLNHGEFLN